MKISAKSKQIMEQIKANNLLVNNPNNITQTTNNILKELYDEFDAAFKFVKTVTNIKTEIKQINNSKEIPKPSSFSPNAFHTLIREHIDTHSKSVIIYSTQIFDKEIKVYFISELTTILKKQYDSYFSHLLVWLYILNEYSLEKCVETLNVYIYCTSLEKQLPHTKNSVLDEYNINTAFTRTCPVNAEIVIFRKEEWFKVFIHETMHTFGLDFSDLDQTNCNKYILTKFNAKSDVRLYEAYAEFWARIINICFVSYINSKSFHKFVNTFNSLIQYEVSYSCIQMVKVLKHMNLDFVSLIHSKDSKKLYKEDTSVLSYFIITFILMYWWQDTLQWCDDNNAELISFKKTTANMQSFCHYIGQKYALDKVFECVKFCEDNSAKNMSSNVSLRMTAIEPNL